MQIILLDKRLDVAGRKPAGDKLYPDRYSSRIANLSLGDTIIWRFGK
jgi:hypothetical protein